jgi:Domain of unknown function (DUF4383)
LIPRAFRDRKASNPATFNGAKNRRSGRCRTAHAAWLLVHCLGIASLHVALGAAIGGPVRLVKPRWGSLVCTGQEGVMPLPSGERQNRQPPLHYAAWPWGPRNWHRRLLRPGFDDFASHTDETLLGFEVNPLHNIVHIVVGIAGLVLTRTAGTDLWLDARGWIRPDAAVRAARPRRS